MKHPRFSELSSFIDRELKEEKLKKIENHIKVCETCKKTVEFLKGVNTAVIENTPQWVTENFLDTLDLNRVKEKRFGISLKKLALGFLAFLILTLPVIGVLRTSYEEKVNKEFQVLIEEHNTIGIEGVIPIKW